MTLHQNAGDIGAGLLAADETKGDKPNCAAASGVAGRGVVADTPSADAAGATTAAAALGDSGCR